MRLPEQRGFTIIEALVALLILSIAAVAIIQVFAAGARLSAVRAARYASFDEAQTRLSVIRAEVLASGEGFDRTISTDQYAIRETAEKVSAAAESTSQTALFELKIAINEPAPPGRTIVTLSDFVIARPPK